MDNANDYLEARIRDLEEDYGFELDSNFDWSIQCGQVECDCYSEKVFQIESWFKARDAEREHKAETARCEICEYNVVMPSGGAPDGRSVCSACYNVHYISPSGSTIDGQLGTRLGVR